MNLIPLLIRRRIEHRPNLTKVLDNIGWLFLDKILRMGVGLFVGAWVARYLGPEQFGQLNFAFAFAALFSAVATLGLNNIVVRDIVRDPAIAPTTLGTAFVLRLFGGLIAFGLIVGTITWLRPEDTVTRLIVAILGFGFIFQSSEVITYWFESQVQSRYSVLVANAAFLIIALGKVAMIFCAAPLIAFVWASLAETCLVAVGLFVIYLKRADSPRHWSVRLTRARTLLTDSWPLILSGIAVMIYMRIDQIMLGAMAGDREVGIYSAALRISEIWYLIPTIIAASLFPSIINAKEQDERLYQSKIQQLLYLLSFISITIAAIVSFFSDWLVAFVYGNTYTEAGAILAVHVWACLFVSLGVAGSKWYVAENLMRLTLYRTLLGAAINIILNYFFIPRYGAIGAAISSLLSQGAASYLFDGLSKKTLFLFKAKTVAIFFFPKYLMRLLSPRHDSGMQPPL